MSFTTKAKQSKRSIKKFKPRNYQKKGVKFILKNLSGGLFWKPGLGKTATILQAFKKLKEAGEIDALYVIAPLRVAASVWANECKEWKDFQHFESVLLHGKNKKEIENEYDIYTINPEGLEWFLSQKKHIAARAMLVVDESTKFKATNTKRFKILKKILGWFDRRYILTGSPVASGYLGLFGQIYILDGGYRLGQYITHYRNKYFYPSGYGGYEWKLQENGAEQINMQIQDVVLHLDAKDHLELPDLITTDILFDLPKKVDYIYKEIEKEFIQEMENGMVIAANAAVATSKLRQIANGGVYLTEGSKEVEHLHEIKVDIVEEIIEELNGEPALIAYDTQHDLERLKKRFGKDTPHVGKGVSVKKGREIEQLWNARELPILLGHPQSIAHGLNLQKGGRAIIWHSLTWSLELYEQFYQRVYRSGVSGTVYMYHILAANTVDEIIFYSLQKKHKKHKQFFERLKTHLLKGKH